MRSKIRGGKSAAGFPAFAGIVSGHVLPVIALAQVAAATLVNSVNPKYNIQAACYPVPTAPNSAFWTANCDSAQPSLGGSVDPGSPRGLKLRGDAGRNLLTRPGATCLDFSVFKNQSIKKILESFSVQFRAEFFNVLNHANFGVPEIAWNHSDIFDATRALLGTAGVLTTTTTSEGEI
jgi:hypothetical protein